MHPFLRWWFSSTVPKIQPTTPAGRERMRYARLISSFLLFILTLAVLALPLRFVAQDTRGNMLGFMIDGLYVFALLCNRKGWIRAAGIFFVVGILLTEAAPVVLAGQFDTQNLPLFDYLVIAILIAGAVLPPASAFMVAAINSVVIIVTITVLPHTSNLNTSLQGSNVYAILLPPIFLQLVVAAVMYVIIGYLLSTIRRADRAEQIAALQKQVADFAKARADEKQVLEHSISLIAQTHARVANGELDARVPLHEHNILWPVAVPLNNLLSRAQAWKREAEMLMKLQEAATRTVHFIHVQRENHHPLYFSHLTGTPLDPVLQEINAMHHEEKSISSHR